MSYGFGDFFSFRNTCVSLCEKKNWKWPVERFFFFGKREVKYVITWKNMKMDPETLNVRSSGLVRAKSGSHRDFNL